MIPCFFFLALLMYLPDNQLKLFIFCGEEHKSKLGRGVSLNSICKDSSFILTYVDWKLTKKE